MVHQVRIDHILQISPSVIRQQDVDGLALLAAAALGGDGVVDAVDDARAARKELVRVDLAHGLRDGFGAERAADLFEGEEFGCGGVLD